MPDVNIQGGSVDLGTYVIDPAKVLDDLELQYARYTSLPLDLARKSDDICLQKYGLTNTQLYNSLKAKMLDNVIDPDKPRIIGVREDFELPHGLEDEDQMDLDPTDDEEDTVELIAKVEKAKDMQSDTCVIIYPLTKAYPYTLDDLEELFSRFNFLSFDLQILSDQECVKLFGNDNRYMYETNKAKLLSRQNKEELDPIKADSYFDGVTTLAQCESVGLMELLIKKLDVMNIKNNGTLYESSLADDGLENIDSAIHLKKSTGNATPEFTPYLIPSEIDQAVGDGTGLSSDERGFLEIYKKSLMEGMKNFDSKGYFNSIKSFYEMRSQNESQSYIINKKMVAYGWNPNLPFNERSFKGARNRIINYMNEFYNPTIVDLQNFNEAITSEEFASGIDTNEGIALLVDVDGNKYFSFTAFIEDLYSSLDRPIISQSLSKDAHITIYMVLLPREVKKAIHLTMSSDSWRLEHKDLFDVFLSTDNEKVTCAKFLAVLAKICKGEVVPGAKVYKIFDNTWDQFRVPEISKLIIDLKTNNPSIGKVLAAFSISEAVMQLHENHSIAYLKNIKCKDTEIEGNKILKEMKDLVTPQIAISEAKQIPIRINDKGVIVDLPTVIEEEYQTVHKALLVYDEKEDYEAMKDSLAHLWYLNLLCERKITKWKDKEKKQQQLKVSRDLRARILNDFKKYLKKVVEHEPEFDFVVYFKKSRWNDRTIFIDAQTIKYTGKIIAAIVKSLIKK